MQTSVNTVGHSVKLQDALYYLHFEVEDTKKCFQTCSVQEQFFNLRSGWICFLEMCNF